MSDESLQPQMHRRWFQFRLRTLLIVVAVLAVPAAWVANERRAIAHRRKTFADLGVGLHLVRDQPPWRVWLLGEDHVGYCGCLTVPKKDFTDDGLTYFPYLARVQILSLRSAPITDVGLTHLKGLTNLHNLCLSDTNITDAGLAHLKGLAQLEWLDLAGTQITDAGLVHLQGLAQLQEISLEETKVTNAGVAALKKALPEVIIIHDRMMADPVPIALPSQ